MRRIAVPWLVAAFWLWAQEPPKPPEPPEEDESLAPKEYAFNPLQAEKELKVGNFYFKKGNYRAAAARFEEAIRWNPSYAEAYLRLGEAREKLKDTAGAQKAFQKYLELAPDSKRAAEIRKKLGQKEGKS
ncbi:MAG TPA: tetratricopeptide repeat protein [Bryobacteraceae bacterium]|nr:tetratricopeptide repeat protein [Bryobacteraceae bacterium]